jgi:ArsR family transcriptional regulator, arsenate/arsenite/antimonite-responsive transcriptional repressor
MKSSDVVAALAALAQENRIAVYRLLVEAGEDGMAPSEIAARLGIAAPTLSFHLKALSYVGLINARQDGRYIYYSANYPSMNQLVKYLTENCCRGGSCAIELAQPTRVLKRKVQ